MTRPRPPRTTRGGPSPPRPAPCPLGYQGGYTDPDTGLTNAQARWYAPALARFTSRDTTTLTPNPLAQANRYLYANATPLTGRDLDGHMVVVGEGGGGYSAPAEPTKPQPMGCAATGDCKAIPQPVSNGQQTGRTRDEYRYVPDPPKQVEPEKSWFDKAVDFVVEHKAQIVGFAVGAVVGIGCGVAIGWTGVGAVACGALAGVAGSLVTGLMEGKRGWDLAGDVLIGGLVGGLTGGLFSMAGQGLSAGVRGLIGGGIKNGLNAAKNAFAKEAVNIASGFANGARGLVNGARNLLGSGGRGLADDAAGAVAGGGGRDAVDNLGGAVKDCLTNSFAAATPVSWPGERSSPSPTSSWATWWWRPIRRPVGARPSRSRRCTSTRTPTSPTSPSRPRTAPTSCTRPSTIRSGTRPSRRGWMPAN